MATVIEVLEKYKTQSWLKEWTNPAWKQFVLSGDEKYLKLLPRVKSRYLPTDLSESLSATPEGLDDHGKRFLRACVYVGLDDMMGCWINKCLSQKGAGRDCLAQAVQIAQEAGCTRAELAKQIATSVRPLRAEDGSLTAAAEFLLSLDDRLAEEMFCHVGKIGRDGACVAELFVAQALPQWKRLLERFIQSGAVKQLDSSAWTLAVKADPCQFLELAAQAYNLMDKWRSRFELGKMLYELDPVKYGPLMRTMTEAQLLAKETTDKESSWAQAKEAACWLVVNVGSEALAPLNSYFAVSCGHLSWHKAQSEYKKEVLDLAAQKFGRQVLPLFEACFATEQWEMQLHAMKLWATLKEPSDAVSIAAKLRHLFTCNDYDTSIVSGAVRAAAELNPEAVEQELWPMLSHKSRMVRDAAVSTLAKLGESRLSKAKELWAARRADIRITAVAWLKAIGTVAAGRELKARLDHEEDDNVRDAILLTLEKMGGGMAMTPAQLQSRIRVTLDKIDGAPVPWLDPQKLPLPKLTDGSTLPADLLLYLFHRQSRLKEMRADIEAQPLYKQIDRKSSGELALAVARAFFGSKADAADRWTMAFAALLGDDRLVPLFSRQIRDWADNKRGKLAEYAVQALALLGTDMALLAVDTMAIRYRSKNKNIGKAASEAFVEAAHARSMTPEELGDLVVPWLGFESGKPRLIEAGKSQIEVRIGEDFKFVFRDTATNKKVAKLPDAAGMAVKAEFKEISAALKEAVKSQLLRMEILMVRQFRWSVQRWQELYLQHPLLLPFTQRLVWGVYDHQIGKLLSTFRTLEDRSLTDAADESLTLSPNKQVGIVHPLELTDEARSAWIKHMADYDVIPAFPQLERPVVRAKPEEAKTRFGCEVEGTDINAMTFKGRAERLGWTRGSVCDAGCVNYYLKRFPAEGVDVFVGTEGMYVGIDMYSDIKLGKIFFVKNGSVKTSGYEYDEPTDEKDPRLVTYGEVPQIAFSEAMGDLVRIAGKSAKQAGKEAEE